MATGRLPFEGEHEAAILYSIVNEAPIPTTTLNPNIDEELQRIIHKALEKDVKDRYQHADDLLADLRKLKKGTAPKPIKAKAPVWRIPAYIIGALLIAALLYTTILKKDTEPTLGKKSIAVLPFTTIDRTEESEIFGEGIHDYLLSQIAKIHDLKVIARTSVLSYKNTDKRVSDIAKELGVETILEGSVYRSGDKIRIIAQLIDAETEDHIWSETYDREYAEIFTIQSDVAHKIAFALQATLSSKEKQLIDEIPTNNLEAYEYYVQAKIIYGQGNSMSLLESAESLLRKAIALDSNFVEPYALLSMVKFDQGRLFYKKDEIIDSGKYFLNKAIGLNPNHPSVLLAEGYYYYRILRDYERTFEIYTKAYNDNPNNSEILSLIGFTQRHFGMWEESFNTLLRVSDIDPQNYAIALNIGYFATNMRKWELADKYLNRAILIQQNQPEVYTLMIDLAIRSNGDLDKARGILEEAKKHVDYKYLIDTHSWIEYLSRNFNESINISNIYKDIGTYEKFSALASKGRGAYYLGNSELAQSYFNSLLQESEKNIQFSMDGWILHIWKAVAYSYLKMEKEALRELELSKNLLSQNPDPVLQMHLNDGSIEIYILLGDFNRAIKLIDKQLSTPSSITVGCIKIEPLYDPLRDHPRFQELIKKYEHTER